MPADTLLTCCSAATLLMAPRPRLTHQRSGGGCQSSSPPENNNNVIRRFAVIHFILGATWLHTDCRCSWSQLSSCAAAAGYWGESCWNTHSIQRHSEHSGMLLRPFKNIIISNLLLVGCRTGSLALGRPSITVLLGQAWRVYGSAKPVVCKSLLVLVCEILIQGCFVFFLCLSLLDVLRKGCVSNSWTHTISNPRSDTMWPDFFSFTVCNLES